MVVAETVFLVDDDVEIRLGITNLVESEGLGMRAFANASDFLAADLPDGPACLLLDMQLSEGTGFEVQEILASRDRQLPIIFLTGFGNIPMTVKAVKAGAVEFLTKPVEPDLMMEAIRSALDVDRLRVQISAQESDWRRRYQALTPRETEVLGYVIGGLMNKQLAAELGTSEITAKVHKRHIMEKMGARSPADLVRIAERLKLTATKTR
jgi:FixJ family two-component response regulator